MNQTYLSFCLCSNSRKFTGIDVHLIYVINIYYGIFINEIKVYNVAFIVALQGHKQNFVTLQSMGKSFAVYFNDFNNFKPIEITINH